MKKPHHVKAIFWFAVNISQFLSDALAFYKALLTPPGNTHVTIAPAVISAAQSRATAAQTAETNVATHTIGTTEARNVAVNPVMTDVNNFVLIVQTAVNNAPNEAAAKQIVSDCGLHTKKFTPVTKGDFKIENDTKVAGELDVIFKAAPKKARAAYELQESTDGVNYVTVKCSPDAHFKYPHQKTLGTKLWFRGRVNLGDKKGGAQPWLYPPESILLAK